MRLTYFTFKYKVKIRLKPGNKLLVIEIMMFILC